MGGQLSIETRNKKQKEREKAKLFAESEL